MSDAEFSLVAWTLAGGVGTLTLRRPPLNVINLAMLREMERALEAAGADPGLRLLVLRAEGKMFSAGVDVADHTADKVGEMIPLFDRVCRTLADFPAPTLAVVHGHALGGGCEWVLCCDLIYAAEGANFGQPEIKLAAVAPIAAVRLPQLVGYRRAAEMLFTGEPFGAVEAARLGLINRAVPPLELEAVAESTIARLAGLSGAALRLCKRSARLGAGGWDNLAALESLYLDELMSTADAQEGLAAFMEKRPAVWKHA